jgi:hypothetical protein
VRSDDGFRAEARRRVAAIGHFAWTDREYPDADWTRAEMLEPGDEASRTLVRPELPLELVRQGPAGAWIWHSDRLSSAGGFERTVTIDAWIGVSTDALYFLSVNEVVIGPATGARTRMGVYDIAPYLRRGENRIHLEVVGSAANMGVLAAAVVDGPSGVQDFSTDARWRSSLDRRAARVVGELGMDMPGIEPVAGPTVRNFWPRWLAKHLFHFVTALSLVLILGRACTAILEERGEDRDRAWTLFTQPFAAATVLLAAMKLGDWDPRLWLHPLYSLLLPAVVLVMVGAWLFIVLVRGHVKSRVPDAVLAEQPR